MLKLMGKKIFTILCLKALFKPMDVTILCHNSYRISGNKSFLCLYTLQRQSQQKSSALVSAELFGIHFHKQCRESAVAQ